MLLKRKDELYLVILTEGFQMLYNKVKRACQNHKDSFEKLRCLLDTYKVITCSRYSQKMQ